MSIERLAGSRIREKRLDQGLRQASLAETVGISPSYLNLIEHNRRRIGGKLLSDIARVLAVEPALLADGADTTMLDQMRTAAGQMGPETVTGGEVARAEEMAGRYPGWAALIAAQATRIGALQQQVEALSDRMTSDPQLAASLHEVISAVSAIRSTASILVGPEQLDADWQRRFHENIHNDSLRLATSSETLITYLEAPDAVVEQSTPADQLDRFLARTAYHLAALEAQGADIDGFVAQSGLPAQGQALLLTYAQQYHADAMQLPYTQLEAACVAHAYDPAAISQACNVPFALVLRRLASLPTGRGHPPFGMAQCDAAGVLTMCKPVPGFTLPRSGDACPLWPLFAAMGRPGQPIRLRVALPGSGAGQLQCYAIAQTGQSARFDVPPPVQSTMLVMTDPPGDGEQAIPVGMTCRICPQSDCTSRREPAMQGVHGQTAL